MSTGEIIFAVTFVVLLICILAVLIGIYLELIAQEEDYPID